MRRPHQQCKIIEGQNCEHLICKPDGSSDKTGSSGPALLAIVIFVFCAGIACGWQMHGGGL